MAQTLTYVRFAPEPEEPPPVLLRGPVAWARDNLFSSIASGLTTLTFVALAIRLLPPMMHGRRRWRFGTRPTAPYVDNTKTAPVGRSLRQNSTTCGLVRIRLRNDGAWILLKRSGRA